MQKNSNNHSQLEPNSASGMSNTTKSYRSGDISIRPELGQVMVADNVARLTPVNMKVLTALLAGAGEVVSRAEIYQQVWSNQIVSDDTLTRAISDIRALFKSLGIESQLIETIPKKGYRWLAKCETSAQTDDQEPDLLVIEQNNTAPSVKANNRSRINWINMGLSAIAGMAFFAILTVSTIWLVKSQYSERYLKVALMPIIQELPKHRQLAISVSEKLQQHVLKTKDIRLLSARMEYAQQQSMAPYLAETFSVTWFIEAEIRESSGQAKVTLNLVDARSAVVLDSVSQTITANQQGLEQLVKRFIARIEAMADDE